MAGFYCLRDKRWTRLWDREWRQRPGTEGTIQDESQSSLETLNPGPQGCDPARVFCPTQDTKPGWTTALGIWILTAVDYIQSLRSFFNPQISFNFKITADWLRLEGGKAKLANSGPTCETFIILRPKDANVKVSFFQTLTINGLPQPLVKLVHFVL